MTVILALILVAWVLGRFGMFSLHIGHGNGPKIDFKLSEYFAVARYSRMSRNFEMCFQRVNCRSGLHKSHYCYLEKIRIDSGF